jgi:uncharacterized protein
MGQGPTPMALGPFQFRGLGFGFSSTSDDLQTPWAEIDVANRIEALQWTGPKSESFSIKGALFPEEFGGDDTLHELRQAALRGEIMMLVTFNGRVHGTHVITAVTRENAYIRSDGLPRQITYTISLKRYQASGPVGAAQSIWT